MRSWTTERRSSVPTAARCSSWPRTPTSWTRSRNTSRSATWNDQHALVRLVLQTRSWSWLNLSSIKHVARIWEALASKVNDQSFYCLFHIRYNLHVLRVFYTQFIFCKEIEHLYHAFMYSPVYMSMLLCVHLKNDIFSISLPSPLYQGNTLFH